MLKRLLSLTEWKGFFPGEWLALEIATNAPAGEPVGRLLAHHPDEEGLLGLLLQHRIAQAYVTFAGDGIAPYYIALFNTVLAEEPGTRAPSNTPGT